MNQHFNKENAEEDDGYSIDEGEEEEDEDDAVSNPAEEKPTDAKLSAEQQYILDNVKPITVRGYVGDSEKLEKFEILAPEQLPDGFKFFDDNST